MISPRYVEEPQAIIIMKNARETTPQMFNGIDEVKINFDTCDGALEINVIYARDFKMRLKRGRPKERSRIGKTTVRGKMAHHLQSQFCFIYFLS